MNENGLEQNIFSVANDVNKHSKSSALVHSYVLKIHLGHFHLLPSLPPTPQGLGLWQRYT